jgi:hypothetical protein
MGHLRIPQTGQEIANRVSMHNNLPARFGYTGKFTPISKFAKADAADTEIAHEAVSATTTPATTNDAGHELGFGRATGLRRLSLSSHT